MGLIQQFLGRLNPPATGTRSIRPQGVSAAEQPTRTVKVSKEYGSSGTPNFSGFLDVDLNPQFKGQRAVDTYEEMRRTDATINATLTALKLPIMAAERTIESADSKDARQNEIAEYVRQNLFDDLEGGFNSFIREALGCLDFGFYYFEKVYEVKDGRLKLKKLAPRLPVAHYKWVMKDLSVKGVTQLLPSTQPDDEDKNTTREIPMSKLVLFTNGKEGDNYEGVSILRSAYKHWKMKDTLYRIDLIKHERGAGILAITLPEGSTPTDKADAEEMGEYFKVNDKSYVVLPSDKWKVELMSAGISDQGGGLVESVKHHDRMITMNILAQFLDLGGGSTGSLALSRDQSDFFTLSLRAIAQNIEETINEQLIKEMVILNFGEQEVYPQFRFSIIGEVDYDEMSTTIERLCNAGLVKKDPELKVWIAKTFGLPDRTVEDFEDDEEETAAPVAPAAPQQPQPEEPDEDAEPADPNEPEDAEEGEFAEKKRYRALTLAEERVKFSEIEDTFDDLEGEMEDALAETTATQKASLLKSAESILTNGNVAAIAGISLVGTSVLASRIQDIGKRAMEKGKATAAQELRGTIPTTSNFTKTVLKTKIDLFLKERDGKIEDAVKARLLDLMNNEVGKANALFELEKLIDKISTSVNDSLVGKVAIDFFNEGRYLSFEDMAEQLHGLQRSEILDNATCPMCVSIDGKVLSAKDPFTYMSQVHTNCRGIWVGVLKTDAVLPTVKELPKSILNKFETVDGVPSVNAFKQLKNPQINKGSRAAQKVMDGVLDI